MQELVVLVDEQNNEIGTCEKAQVHTSHTPLHRAFSCFLFTKCGKLLLQQRALSKKTWPGVWSNSCCGHPLPGESTKDAIQRRLNDELGIRGIEVIEILPNYRYQATFQGVMENELCPVWVGAIELNSPIHPNPDEVESTRFVDWEDLVTSVTDEQDFTWDHLSIWCREEIELLSASDDFRSWRSSHLQEPT